MAKGLFIFLVLPLLMFSACSPSVEEAQPRATVESWLPLAINGVALEAQVALTPAEQRKGLMYREELGADRGMLFPYTNQQGMAFWMANTPLPLDIAFFDDKGMLLEVHRMVPYDTKRTQSRSRFAQYALEMNAGWFASHRLFPGVKLDMQLLARALEQRGANPAEYGIRPPEDR
jgi:uncharacterized membrane protein (UPF0127 family)